MPQQTDSATRKSLKKIDDNLEGRKLRVAGRVLAYDVQTGLILLIDKDHGLLVDVELCLNDESAAWATERLSTIMAIGHLERSLVGTLTFRAPSASEASALTGGPRPQIPLAIPTVPSNAPQLKMNRGLVLRAILVVPTPDLDLELWNEVSQEEEEGRYQT